MHSIQTHAPNADHELLYTLKPVFSKGRWDRLTVVLLIIVCSFGIVYAGNELVEKDGESRFGRPRPGDKLSLISWNVYGMFLSPGQTERAKEIGNRLRERDFDIILLQEAWIHGRWTKFSKHIYNAVEDPHISYRCNINPSKTLTLDSGLGIISKYPIVEFEAYQFTSAQPFSFEPLANKGVAYAQIKVNEEYSVHVFNTHIHANHYAKDESVQKYQIKQIVEIHNFMHKMAEDYKFDLDSQDVILAGDFNTNILTAELIDSLESRTTLNGALQMSPVSATDFFDYKKCPNKNFTSLTVYDNKTEGLKEGYNPLCPTNRWNSQIFGVFDDTVPAANYRMKMNDFDRTFGSCFSENWWESSAQITRTADGCPQTPHADCPCCSCTEFHCLSYEVWDLQFSTFREKTTHIAKGLAAWEHHEDDYESIKRLKFLSDHWPLVTTWKIPEQKMLGNLEQEYTTEDE